MVPFVWLYISLREGKQSFNVKLCAFHKWENMVFSMLFPWPIFDNRTRTLLFLLVYSFLVGGCIPTPLKKIRVRQLGWFYIPNISGKIPNSWQPVTTNSTSFPFAAHEILPEPPSMAKLSDRSYVVTMGKPPKKSHSCFLCLPFKHPIEKQLPNLCIFHFYSIHIPFLFNFYSIHTISIPFILK